MTKTDEITVGATTQEMMESGLNLRNYNEGNLTQAALAYPVGMNATTSLVNYLIS